MVDFMRKRDEEGVDSTKKILLIIGIGLIISYILPIIVPDKTGSIKVVFLNIEIFSQIGVDKMIITQLFYPLLAGMLVIVLASANRSAVKALALIITGVLPVLVLFIAPEIREVLDKFLKESQGLIYMGLAMFLALTGATFILSGAHAARVNPAIKIAGFIAAIGAVLSLISNFIPIEGKFQVAQYVKLMTEDDLSGKGILFLYGLAGLMCIILLIIITLRCFQLLFAERDKVRIGKSIIHLWFVQLYIFGALYMYVIIATMNNSDYFLLLLIGSILLLVKIVAWIIGLYLLIPLGIAEFILLSPTPTAPTQK